MAEPSTAYRYPAPLRLIGTVLRRAIVDRIRSGRLRDVGWPYGLRGIVFVGYLIFAVGAVLVLGSAWLRQGLDLDANTVTGFSMPAGLTWLLIFMITFVAAVFQTASIHGPWWLKVLGIVVSTLILGIWATGGGATGSLRAGLITVVTVLLLLALLAVSLIRGRSTFAWWEFPVVLAILGTGLALSVARIGFSSRALGYEFGPPLLHQTVAIIGLLALPAGFAAGAAVAEITVGVTVAAFGVGRRLFRGRTGLAVLAGIVVLRVVQSIWELSQLDPVTQGRRTWATTAGYVILIGLVGLAAVKLAGNRSATVDLAGLPERLGKMAFPIGAALFGALLPFYLVLFGLQILVSLDPTGFFAGLPFDSFDAFSSTGLTAMARLVAIAVLLFLGFRRARAGDLAAAMLLGTTAIMVLPVPLTWLAGGTAVTLDADLLNLLATAAVLLALGVAVVRRRLTTARVVALAAVLVLSVLFANRDFVSNPLGAVLGVSGVGLVLFGLVWDLLTDCDFSNRGSRRLTVPTRVLLQLANFVLTVTVVGYVSLIGLPAVVGPDLAAELGDFVLGTALLSSAFVVIISGRSPLGREIDPLSEPSAELVPCR